MTDINSKIQKAKDLMELGWKTRESLEFEKAEELLNEAKELFEKEGDWYNVSECLNHLAYSEKLKALHSLFKGYKLAETSYQVTQEHNTKQVLALRALMSLANVMGNFEAALKYCEEALPNVTKPMDKADILAHKAAFLLRTGKLQEAEETIEEAENLAKEYEDTKEEPHKTIWKTKILVTKGLVLYNQGKVEEAEKLGKEAMKLAVVQNLKTRTLEIQYFLDLFNK